MPLIQQNVPREVGDEMRWTRSLRNRDGEEVIHEGRVYVVTACVPKGSEFLVTIASKKK